MLLPLIGQRSLRLSSEIVVTGEELATGDVFVGEPADLAVDFRWKSSLTVNATFERLPQCSKP